VGLVDVLVPAEDDEPVEVVEIGGDGVGVVVGASDVEPEAVVDEGAPEASGVLFVVVLEDDDSGGDRRNGGWGNRGRWSGGR
jgi:hypothetical protein